MQAEQMNHIINEEKEFLITTYEVKMWNKQWDMNPNKPMVHNGHRTLKKLKEYSNNRKNIKKNVNRLNFILEYSLQLECIFLMR